MTTFLFMNEIENIDDFRISAAADKPFCAVFSADWCPDCRILKAVLPGLEDEYGDHFVFSIVDRDRFPSLAGEFDIMGIPSFVVLRRGEKIGTYISKLRKTRRQITDFLDEILAGI